MRFSEILGIKIIGRSLPGSLSPSLRRRPNVPGKNPVDGDNDGFVTGPDGSDTLPATDLPSLSMPHNPGHHRKRRRERLPVREGRVRDRDMWDEEGFDKDPEENENRRFNQDRVRDHMRERRRNRFEGDEWFYDDAE